MHTDLNTSNIKSIEKEKHSLSHHQNMLIVNTLVIILQSYVFMETYTYTYTYKISKLNSSLTLKISFIYVVKYSYTL